MSDRPELTRVERQKRRQWRHRGQSFVALMIAVVVLGAAGTAFAFWTASATGSGASKGDTLAAPTGVSSNGTPTASAIQIKWTGPAGYTATGYAVLRCSGSGCTPTTPITNGTCSAVATALNCVDNDSGLAAGTTYNYAVTAALNSWTSPASASFQASTAAAADLTAPTNSLSLSNQSPAGSSFLVGNTVYYRGSALGSFTITNTLTDAGSGPKSSTFAALAGTAPTWTHSATTVSTPSGGPYVSTTFSWTAGTTTSPTETVTGIDNALNSNAPGTTLTFTNDSTVPSSVSAVAGAALSDGTALPGSNSVKTNGKYYVYANVTDAASGGASALATVTTLGGTTAALASTGGPWTVAGTSYAYRSALQTVGSAITAGAKNITVTGTDNVGNTTGNTTVSVTVDNGAPTLNPITRVGATPTNATSLQWTLTFSEAVDGLSSSNLALATANLGGTTPSITSVTPNTAQPATTWTVTVSTSGTTGTNAGSIGLNLNNNTGITDAASNALTTPSLTGPTYSFDTTVPLVTSISSSSANGSYVVGSVIPITVNFSENVTVAGTPQLTLTTGSPATTAVNYSSGSGTSTLTFNYTVASGNASADLDYVSTSALALNGGTIRDAATNNATLTLAPPGAAGSLGANKDLVIDSTAPSGVAIATAPNPQDGKPNAGDQVILTFSEPMSANSILSGWSGSSTSISVHFDTGCSNNCLTFNNVGGNSVNLGTIDLGATANYAGNHGGRFDVNATMVMATNGSNQSVITITLGANTTGNTVNSNTTLKWTPSASATDLAGNAASTTQVTEAAAKINF